MSQKINEFANKIPGAPKGLGVGVGLLAAGVAALYGINKSMYTGNVMYPFRHVCIGHSIYNFIMF